MYEKNRLPKPLLSIRLLAKKSRYPQLFFALILFGTFPAIVNAGWFSANNFDECILESMKGVTSDTAAGAIHRACREKFPIKGPSDSPVPPEVVSQLDGRGGYSYGYFKGTIYNGNKGWTITQLTIVLRPKSKSKTSDQVRPDKEYNVNVTVPPLANVEFIESVANDGATDFEWRISSARGYQK